MLNLPDDYSMNLAELPDEQRKAIEEDKQRWLKAWRMVRKMEPQAIRNWLAGLQDQEYRKDMARRLNRVRDNGKEKTNDSGGAKAKAARER